ncbi:DUF4062 domain-containing protein [Paractinoplanes rishiriensis]|uniref:NACHT domain-containing protein n=1 Tax=Paractinoplanes rishiriensis TaxID=1050105 RepID=A0A919JVX0_9ACTN|nr:DUF4062 domain-containing protein [Actinoplanes rishiriensis]GIE94412.1 hypothetical protein Ari01nite_18770 [Actinoplanes rishiriensis]
MRIFVSSTYRDLAAHRELITQVLARMKLQFSAMEHFGSRGDEALPVCEQEIDECDIFVGVYAWRYGWQPAPDGPSITELEFDRAAGKIRLCYVIDDDHPWPPPMIDQAGPADRLAAFKERVGRLVRSTFTTPENLAGQVATDLAREVSRLGGGPAAPAPERAWGEYCLRLAAELGRDTESTAHYVPLDAEVSGRRSDLERRFRRWLDDPAEPLLAVLGDFGSGKTTFARHVCRDLATAWKPGAGVLPVLIPLRAYRSTATLSDMLGAELRRLGGDTTRLGEVTRLLIVLDGLDEQAERFSDQETSRLLFQVSGRLPAASKIMLTCRTHFFRDEIAESRLLTAPDPLATGLLAEGRRTPTLYLAPLSVGQRQEYLRRTQGDGWQRAERTIERIYDLKDLANRPILLNLITHLLPELRAEGGGIGQARLYEIAAEKWLERERWRGLEPAEVLHFVEELAFTSLMRGRDSIHHRHLTDSVRRHFEARILSAVDLQAWDGIVRTSLFLNRDPNGNYTFMHKSFEEYFAARAFVAGVGRPFRALPSFANQRVTEEMRTFIGELLPRESSVRLFEMLGDDTSYEASVIAARTIIQLRPPVDPAMDDALIDQIGRAYRTHNSVSITTATHYVFVATRNRRTLPILLAELYEHPSYRTAPAALATIATIADNRDSGELIRLRERMIADMQSVLALDDPQLKSRLRELLGMAPDGREAAVRQAFATALHLGRTGREDRVTLSDLTPGGWKITLAEVDQIILRLTGARPGAGTTRSHP